MKLNAGKFEEYLLPFNSESFTFPSAVEKANIKILLVVLYGHNSRHTAVLFPSVFLYLYNFIRHALVFSRHIYYADYLCHNNGARSSKHFTYENGGGTGYRHAYK